MVSDQKRRQYKAQRNAQLEENMQNGTYMNENQIKIQRKLRSTRAQIAPKSVIVQLFSHHNVQRSSESSHLPWIVTHIIQAIYSKQNSTFFCNLCMEKMEQTKPNDIKDFTVVYSENNGVQFARWWVECITLIRNVIQLTQRAILEAEHCVAVLR